MVLLLPTRAAQRVAGALLLAGLSCTALAHVRHAEMTPWEQAEHGRERLEAIAPEARTRADYAHTLDLYRAIYHGDPADVHAPSSIYAVAQILAEEGRTLHDAKRLQDAVAQYEFLRTQYPRCSLNTLALLAEAQIEQNDLHDAKAAKERYQQLLKESPKSGEAEEARAAIAELERPARHSASRTSGAVAAAAKSSVKIEKAETPAPVAQKVDVKATPEPQHHGPLALVSGIRHWSTPDYTRVVIDLGSQVTYEAARVPNPDRIYFDLHGTRLAQELVGKNFNVTDNGFLKRIRAAQFRDDMTRVVLDVNDVTEYSAFLLPNPYRLIIDIHGRTTSTISPTQIASLPPEATVSKPMAEVKPSYAHDSMVVPSTTTSGEKNPQEVATLSEQPDRVKATNRPTSQPISAVVPDAAPDPAADVSAGKEAAVVAPPAPKRRSSRRAKSTEPLEDASPARAAVPTADGETSLVRALGLKINRIVIDAGHGGHDSGTLGYGGIQEKDVVLDVALRLGKLLHERLGSEIVYTRTDDTFIPLETRTAIANKAQADLFISIHANSSPDSSARGVETYYLNFTSDPTALDVAARENAVSDQSIHQLSDLVKKIALKDKIEESREFASDVEQGLYTGLHAENPGLKNRGVKKAPFVVLIGANMPSILAEISFVTNPQDARELERPEYREHVAESLYRGVARYVSGLSGPRAPVERASGQ